jgi:CheY-like chemotaxis protein
LLDPAATIESALTAIRPTAAEKGIRIVKKLEPQVGLVSGDPARLQQVIWNIVSNAVKFTPEFGNIEVSLHRVATQIKISIADNGPGISSDVLPHIFNRFEQGDSSTTRRHGGLGLGLAIAKQLVELHSGTIEVESEGKGRGARFIITLPVSAPNRGNNQENSQTMSDYSNSQFRGKSAALQGLKVLIVEDDADARAVMRRIVLDMGADALPVKGVDQALAAIDEFKPDILVSDLGMPDQDGYDLIRQVRDRGFSHQDLPAIALTAFARSEDRRRALLAGFQMHVAKPVDPHEIVAAIAALAGRTGVTS